MIARIANFFGDQVGLLVAQPNWDTEIKVTLELPTDISKEAITFNESRRNFAQSARYGMKWTSYLSKAADSTELRLFLQRIRDETVVVPLWPDVCELQNPIAVGQRFFILVDVPVRYGAIWIIQGGEEFSPWEFVTVTSLDPTTRQMRLSVGVNHAYPAGTRIYPILLGRLDERPKPEAINDETLEAEFSLKENSAFAYRVSPVPIPLQNVGTNIPEFATTRKWTVLPNHARPLDWTEMPDVVYEHVGFLREDQQRVYDHRTPRGQELEFYENNRTDASRIEYFWRDRRANVLRFMIPTYHGDLRMKADTPVPGHPTWINCERSFFSNPGRQTQPGDSYIALINQNDVVTPYKLNSAVDVVPDITRLTATVNVGAFTATKTIVSHLLLARFVDPTLEWTYTTPYLVTTRLKFQELPHEYPNILYPVPPPPLPEPAYLFIFKEVGIRTDLFTSYENTITIPTGTYRGTYIPAPFSFDTLKVGLRLDQEKLEFKSFKFAGNPLNKMWPFALDAILTLEIVEVRINPNDPLHVTAPLSRFYGDVWSVDSDYKATAVPFGNLFDRKFPRFLLSVSDNYTLFSEPTHLTPSGWAIAGTLSGAIFHTQQKAVVLSVPGHAKAIDYFAGGWLETGTGVNLEKRGILHSSPGTGNLVNLDIDRPLLKAVTGAAAKMYPGYDGSIDQCESRFNNRINFGGHAFIPNVNPAVKAIKPKQTDGGKKA